MPTDKTHLNVTFKRKQPYMAKNKFLFHQDNAPVHKRLVSTATLCELLLHLPYSPERAVKKTSSYFLILGNGW